METTIVINGKKKKAKVVSHYEYFNPNPKARYKADGTPYRWHKGDCSIRALCAVTGKTWHEVYDGLCEIGRKICNVPCDTETLDKYLVAHGFKPCKAQVKPRRVTVKEFAQEHPTGEYFLQIASHVVGVSGGLYLDVWDCGHKYIYKYYEKV